MSSTNIQLNGSELESKLHSFFGTTRPDLEFDSSSNQKYFRFDAIANIQGIIFKPDLYNFKKYWCFERDNKIIITTALMAHGDLESKASFQHNFNKQEIKELVQEIRNLNQDKEIHLIIPRVETSLYEDHIVVEYQSHCRFGSSSLIIDSKPSPSGFRHSDIKNRIHTGRQGIFNSTDCGFHVSQLVPILGKMVGEDIEINADTINANIPLESALAIAIDKLKKLKEIYSQRVANGELFHNTLGCQFFSFLGHSAKDKLQAVEEILQNIESDNENILPKVFKKAACQGTLGSVVQEYLDAQEALAASLQIK